MTKILVSRKNKLYVREYPEDYKKFKETGDYSYIHPNKLKTWVEFSKSAIAARGKTIEDVVFSIIENMKDKHYKAPKGKIAVTVKEYAELKMQAFNKGLNMKVIDDLVTVKQKKVEKKKYLEVLH